MKSLITIIGNPAARKSTFEKIKAASDFLEKKGFDTEILLTGKRSDAESFARKTIASKPLRIIAAGGDGTVNEVINGVVHSGIPVAILPLGTTNVLAKELSIPEDMQGAMDTAISKNPRTVSLGKIELPGSSPQVIRYFCLMAGIGFDGKAVHGVNTKLKKISGRTAYVLSGIKNLLAYSPDKLSFNVDGRGYSGYGCIAGKASRYGGHFIATPDASLLAPELYTFIYKGGRRIDLVRYVMGVLRGTHLGNNDVEYLQSKYVEIQGSAHIQIDGDYLGVTPARISVEKEALELVF